MMNKKLAAAFISAMILLTCSSCFSLRNKPMLINETDNEATEEESAGKEISDSVNNGLENANQNSEESAEDDITYAMEPEVLDNGNISMTAREFPEFVEFLGKASSYGFTLSLYDDVRDVDLNQLLYGGAGMSDYDFSSTFVQAYLDYTGDEELYSEVMALKESDIDAFLLENTGYTLAEMNKKLDWIYLPDEKVYLTQVGDTNYYQPQIYDGSRSADGKYIYLEIETPIEIDPAQSGGCLLMLEKAGDSYRFVSNVKINN